MANTGKIFEEDFFKSCLPLAKAGKLSIDRFYDVLGGRKGIHTICDYVAYVYPMQVYFELKTIEGKSLPFDAVSDGQFNGLMEKSLIMGCMAGVLIKFRPNNDASCPTYFVSIGDFAALKGIGDRKSIPIETAELIGVRLPALRKRTRFTYDIESFMKNMYDKGGYAWRKQHFQKCGLLEHE